MGKFPLNSVRLGRRTHSAAAGRGAVHESNAIPRAVVAVTLVTLRTLRTREVPLGALVCTQRQKLSRRGYQKVMNQVGLNSEGGVTRGVRLGSFRDMSKNSRRSALGALPDVATKALGAYDQPGIR
jgi:hypothetical protein